MARKINLLNRFSFKIILTLLLVTIIPTLLTSVSFYMASDAILKKNVRNSTVQVTRQTADSLSSIFNAGIDISDQINSDESIQLAVMQLGNSTAEDRSRLYQDVKTKLNTIVYSNSYVKNVYVLKEEGKGWGSGGFSDYRLKRVRLSEQPWVKEAKKMDGRLAWQGIQYDRFSGSSKSTDLVVSVGRVMKDFHSLRNIGFLLVSINGRSILSTIEQLKLGQTGKFFVVDSEGRIMIDSDLSLIGTKIEHEELYDRVVKDDAVEFEFKSEGRPYYGVKQQLSNNWMLIATVPVHEITGQLEWIRARILFSSVIFGLLAVIVGLIIARWILRPIKQLTDDVRLVQQGNLKVRTGVHSSDEIGYLGMQINKMLHTIEHLMKQIKDEQSKKHHAELRAVIHRVNPHFLFNTLSTLRWLIKSNRNDHAFKGLTDLTRLLEANMAKSGTMITVEEELEIIRRYLMILELCYEKTFALEIDIEPGTDKIAIPRMLLQPIVENAIFHGIVPKKTGGRIWIKVRFIHKDVQFLVMDDGLGIKEDKLKILNEPEKAIESGEIGIGLQHVYDSIRLYYHHGSKWSVTSSPDKGTTVSILLIKPETLE